MPRERIKGEEFDVSVGWHRDARGVQIASIIQNGALSQDGVSQLGLGELVDSWSESDRSFAAGLYAEITDRSQINQLIRLLRKARDQVFGKDE